MLFSEPGFLFYFLPLILALHSFGPRRARNPLLLAASLVFYAWGEPRYVLVLLASIAWNYAAGLSLAAAARSSPNAARGALAAGVAGNLALLGWYKYVGFLGDALGLALPAPALPIGISFYTFHSLSYLVDVYRGEARVQRSPLILALYVSMFPQLIAGPIVRYHDVAAQLAERCVDAAGFAAGIRRFSVGLAKKMMIANTLALPADRVFALPAADLTAGLSWLALACYSFQIYFDFSGYSDMAIGLGRMFGFRFRENFDHPYASRSLREFWRRWHISLSTWFRDYLYLPLGGSRRSRPRVAFNLWLVFLLCGLWHGAAWTFVLWGAWHGLFLALERVLGWPGERPGLRPLARAYTLLVVAAGWLLFRSEDLAGAAAMARALAGFGTGDGLEYPLALLTDARTVLALAAAVLGATPVPRNWVRAALRAAGERAPLVAAGLRGAEVAGHAALLLGCASLMAAGSYDPFIYFRF